MKGDTYANIDGMQIFHYTQTANAAGIKQLPALIICGVLLAWFIYSALSKNKPFDTRDYAIIMAIVGFIVFAGLTLLKQINSVGSWNILIDDKVLQWNAPEGIEKSFLINLDQITEFRITQSHSSSESDYTILTSDNQEITLSETSGIDLIEFAKALASQGIQVNEINEEGE